MGTLVRLIAVLACAIVGIAFLMFAVDEVDRGSKTQQQALGDELGTSGAVAPAANADEQGGVGGAIERANDALLTPFDELVDSDDAWVEHGVPALLGLLLYGVGLGLLANFLPKQRRSDGDWRVGSLP